LESVLASERLDFVDIVTPPWLHREDCLLAAQAGLHLICQKPLCDRLDEAEELVEALRRHPRYFVVHENHRFRPWFQEVLQLFRAGFFGKLRHVQLEQHDPVEPPEKIDTEVEQGVLLQYGVHLVDMAHALLGDPTRVHAWMQRINPRVRGESLAHVVMEYPEVSAVLDVSWKSAGLQQGHALVVGERGEAYYEGRMARADTARFRVCQGNTVVRDEVRSPTADYVDSFYRFERDFTDAVLGGRPPPQPAAENVRSLRVAFAAYESARSGCAVEMNGFGPKHERAT
jgi:predicted dehydrogenase